MPGDVVIDGLEQHPNLPAILGVLAQLPHIADADLAGLAAAWRNTVSLAEARQRALSPDAPLVVEVLAVFEVISALFADDLAGSPNYPNYIENDPAVTGVALNAVRDAVTAVYAHPILARWEYRGPHGRLALGVPEANQDGAGSRPGRPDIKRLLETLPRLARRCHDAMGREAFERLVVAALTLDEDTHTDAVETAFHAAVLTGRRRLWVLLRRSTAKSLAGWCPTCHVHGTPSDGLHDEERVLGLCADAACGLLVCDVVGPWTSTLIAPISQLLPLQPGAPG